MKLACYKGKRGGTAGFFDAAVRWWTRGPYSHVELVFSDGMSASSSMRDGGVRFKEIEYHPDRWDFIELNVDEEYVLASILKRLKQDEEQLRRIADELAQAFIAHRLNHGFDEALARAWFTANEGARYDWLGLFGFVWRPGNGKGRRWFCSEAIAAALGMKDPWRFCPNTLAAALRNI